MRIGLASYRFINNDIGFNLSQVRKALGLSQGRADMLCFGETFLQGFDALSWTYERDKEIGMTQASDTMDALRAMTLEFGTDLLLGYIERDGDALYSSCAVIAGGEIVHHYRRITKNWKEYTITDGHYREGTDVHPFAYKGKEIEIALCGDLWICPERFQTQGLVIWPIYVNFTIDEWQEEQHAYAAQAALAAADVLMVNSISADPDSYGGAFYFKDGKIAKKLEFGKEDILIVELD